MLGECALVHIPVAVHDVLDHAGAGPDAGGVESAPRLLVVALLAADGVRLVLDECEAADLGQMLG